MKKVILWIFLFVGTIQLQSQVTADGRDLESMKPVNNLCFEETYQEYIQVIGTLDTSTLNIQDKLMFGLKEYVKKQDEYFNENGKATHDAKFISHEGIFPQWYTPPVLTRQDETGIKSYMAGNNPYYNGGWAGDYVTGDLLDKYKVGSNGEKYYFEPYTIEQADDYASQDSIFQSLGFLITKIFAYPNSTTLGEYRKLGYTVSENSQLIRVQKEDEILTWDKQRKAVITQFRENGNIVHTFGQVYEYNAMFNEYILARTYSITLGQFSNGNNYNIIESTIYTKYSQNCETANSTVRIAPLATANELNVYPNPSLDYVYIDIPKGKEDVVLEISNVSKQVMLERKLNGETGQYRVKTKAFPPGMYIVRVQQGSRIYSAKFVKQ